MKVARFSFSGSIPAKFEHKLRCLANERLEKLSPQLYYWDKDENLSRSGLQCHRSCHSNEMTTLTIKLDISYSELFLQNRSRELFPPIVASMFVKLRRNL